MTRNQVFFAILTALAWMHCNGEVSFPQETDPNGGYHYEPPPDNSYLPPPTPVYGPPPPPSYGPPPAPVYGPPPAPVYGPPPPVFYKHIGAHSHEHWLLEKIKGKISLFAIGKIILKLLIFKKIVKFIGIICLLLFLPKLKGLVKDDMSMDEDGMDSKHAETEKDALEKRIEDIYDFVTNAISSYDDEDTADDAAEQKE